MYMAPGKIVLKRKLLTPFLTKYDSKRILNDIKFIIDSPLLLVQYFQQNY